MTSFIIFIAPFIVLLIAVVAVFLVAPRDKSVK
ncbi:hypothetical protein ACFSKI_17045 [Pseudogracilibacillus auburnensis]|uniref:Uncharacterized protein n=1 Tax=Pseudogracilibacillus auburnensis TaxID=1494959 RepID=A0A2V3W828_9BACI|nr:hypothetical protein DFR56_102100 [Pseudogracilibacillus auburnensis]